MGLRGVWAGDSMLGSVKPDAPATGHPGVCQEESLALALAAAGGHLPVTPPCCPCSLTEIALFAEIKSDQADGPKEPPQSVRFVFGKGCAGHYFKGPRRA